METNLEAQIQEHAAMMAGQMAEIARFAESEEDVRLGCTKLIDDFIEKANLNIRGRHEYGLAGGRIDSKYGVVVIEYKHPKGAGRLSASPDSPGVREVVSQIQGRFTDLQQEEQVGMERILGVGCDGNFVVFVTHKGRELEVSDPHSVTPYLAQRLLRALVSLGARGHSFTPNNLSAHFGEGSKLAEEGIHTIYQVICETESSRAETFFKQWQILFGEVCGYDIHGKSSRIDKLGGHYLIPDANPAELLFAVHTYYAIFIKLLAAEVVSSFSPLGMSALKKLAEAPTSKKLRLELRELEQGGIWSKLGISNFLEGDLFSWYLDAWDDRLDQTLRKMVGTLDNYDPRTLSVEPTESRDLLKKLYQRLFPKSVRHDLGEYYTPDWLAELTLNELGYDGNPDKRLLDPACGSGTFLVMTINRIKTWFDEHRHECGFQEDELLRKILRNVIGFDLNPLAVMASRTNYLLAIRDLLRYGGEIELPVYLCDSIMTPSTYGDQSTGQLVGKALRLKTSAGGFLIPTEVTTEQQSIGKYADELEFCVRNGYDPDEFIARCEGLGLPMAEKPLHKQLYRRLCELDTGNQNGIWARIIKNAFAPLFIKKVDYVAGNPPWVNWESLPEDYRDFMTPLWKQYGLFSLSGSAGRLGGGKKDLSMLFVYSAVDNYLPLSGRLGFVITQSVFKTKGAGDGFRRLGFVRADAPSDDEQKNIYLKPVIVHDISAMQVFEGATNRTAVFVCEKHTKAFNYPVPYVTWSGPSRIRQDAPLSAVLAMTEQATLFANPVQSQNPSSPWLTAPEKAIPGLQKVIGRSGYRAYEGVNTGGLNGCYWIRILKTLPGGNLLIENLHNVGKIKVECVQAVIEPDLVYPLLRGRDVSRWRAGPSCHIILAQDPKTRAGIPESKMKQDYAKTFAYLKQFEGDKKNPRRGTLRGRSGYKRYFRPTDPFYSMYDVGEHTLSEWKVVWAGEVAPHLNAAVIHRDDSGRLVLNDQTAYHVPFDEQQEALYFCGLMNSTPVRMFYRAVAYKHTSMNFFQTLDIPKFDQTNDIHRRFSGFARDCHRASLQGDQDAVQRLQLHIDELAAQIWSITPDELAAIRESLGRE